MSFDQWCRAVSVFICLSVLPMAAHAVSVGEKADDDSVAAQLASFVVHEDFEISLFADESMGIANPVAMHWDGQGRLWVLTTLTYAQLEPGERASDTLVILDDTDQDGVADQMTVFAEGLDMPMGFALGNGGVYLGEGANLLFLSDSDGDGRADTREVILTGFGTGDTHQNISNFTWGPDGCLYFSQGLHAYSRVETPWGIVRGEAAGFWRFHPATLRLEPFCFPSLASQNPCGIAFDRTGAMFLKSNNRELIYVTPGLIPTTHNKNLVPVGSIGATPGKSMGGEFVESSHLPDWLQNHILIAGYYSHRVTAFPLVPDGAGYARVVPVELLSSSHSSFRPVEIRTGPDGAIYIADWYNPIIGHYQASLRHPDRDDRHGRIWRVVAKGRTLLDPSNWAIEDQKHRSLSVTEEQVKELVSSDDPRARLNGIVAASSFESSEAVLSVLEALDFPRDRFIDYALEQAVHALAPHWLPAVQGGQLAFERPEHLAYALMTLGGAEALAIAREKFEEEDLSVEARSQLARVLARSGSPMDLIGLLESDGDDPFVLQAMADAGMSGRSRPADGFVPILNTLLKEEDALVQIQVVRLAGRWRVRELAPQVNEILEDESASVKIRGEAANAISKITGAKAVSSLVAVYDTAVAALKPAVAEAIVSVAPARAAQLVATDLAGAGSSEIAAALLSPLLSRKGVIALLAEELRMIELDADAASQIASAMSQSGRSDEVLMGVLHDVMGMTAGGRAYSPDFVETLAAEVNGSGDSIAGKAIYHRAELTCAACHQLAGEGGVIGPSLDAVGAGLPVNLLIESVLWPSRQLKEGYFAVAVTTKGGDVYSGYREKEEGGILHLRDTASGLVKEVPRLEVSKLDNVGTLMPEGLTNGLSREELRDLVAYLASLKG